MRRRRREPTGTTPAHRVSLAGLLLLLSLPAAAAAQQRAWPVTEGDRVRLYTPSGDTLRAEGVVERMVGDSIVLVLDPGAGRFAAALAAHDLIAVRREVPAAARVRRRAFWGAFLGASIGGIAGPFVAGIDDSRLTTGQAVGIGVGAGGLVGAGLGALLGAVMPQHRWERFRLDPGAGLVPGGR